MPDKLIITGDKMIGMQLKELKDKRKLTNQQLADLSGVPIGTINRILAGQTENPSFQTVYDMVVAMEGSLDELAGIRPQNHEEAPSPDNGIIRLYEKMIEGKDKWLFRLFICCGILTLFVMGMLTYDLLNPAVGFFRR